MINYLGGKSGSGDRGGELNNPRDTAVNDSGEGPADVGDVYVADEDNNRVQRFSSSGAFVSAWGANVTHRDEVQKLSLNNVTAGTFTLTFEGDTTDPVVYFADAETLDDALDALPSIGADANVEVTATEFIADDRVYTVTFTGTLTGTNFPPMIVDAGGLVGDAEVTTVENGSGGGGSDYEICTLASRCGQAVASGGNGTAAGNGSLDSPQSVAVDQDTGNVYVSDRDNRRVSEYDGEGNFIRSFGFDVAESGPGDTGTGYEICNDGDGDVCKAGEGGSGVGQYGTGSPSGGFGITVSPADGSASTGTVFLADAGNQRVDTYNLDGTSPASFGSASNFGSEQPLSVAVDSRGIVYASNSNGGGEVERYDSQDVNGGGVGFLAPILSPVDEVQKVTFTGFATGDKYTLTCPNGSPTGELAYVSGANGLTVIRQGLEEACGVGNISVAGNPPTTTVTLQDALGSANQPQMSCTKLSGTGSCAVSTTTEGSAGPLLRGDTSGLAVDPDSDGAGSDVDVLFVVRDPAPDDNPAPDNTVVQQFGSIVSPPGHAPGLTAPPAAVDDTHGSNVPLRTQEEEKKAQEEEKEPLPPHSGFTAVRGFGLSSVSGRLYLSANPSVGGLGFAHRIYALAEASSLASPFGFTAPVSTKSARTATFEGNVSPEGGLISCKFQYSTDELTWTDVSVPACGALSSVLSQGVTGLIPNTKYFVRLQITRTFFPNSTPTTSNIQSFTTDPEAPLVTGAKVSPVDDSSVRVSAAIDPGHSPTSYVVQYGTTPSLGSSTAPAEIGNGVVPVEVSPVIGGLKAVTTYYFRLVAANPAGSAASATLATSTFTTLPSFDPCSNDQFRTGGSAKLPDCRAYEQVTPIDKFGTDASGTQYSLQASRSGDGITSFVLAGFPGGEGLQNTPVYVSSLNGGEWSTQGWMPPPSYGDNARVQAWTPDLDLSLVTAAQNDVSLNANGVFLRDSSTNSITTIAPHTKNVSPADFAFGGASADHSKVFIAVRGPVPVTSGPAAVSANTKTNVYLYDRDTGELTLAGLLPDSACGSPPCVPATGSTFPAVVSSDRTAAARYRQEGANVVSEAGDLFFLDDGGQLYLRRDAAGPAASTVRVSASERTDCADQSPCSGIPEPDPAGPIAPGQFGGATADGSRAFFTSEEELTDDASTASGAVDLYSYDTEAPAGGHLTDLVPGADVLDVLGFSDDGSYVYFLANADLDGSGPAVPGTCGGSASSGNCNIYFWHDDGNPGGSITYVSRVDRQGVSGSNDMMSRVSADGRVLVFRSYRSLTGYENGPAPEFYRYDHDSEELNCVTCSPTGAPPQIDGDESALPSLQQRELIHVNSSHLSYFGQPFLSRNLSADGKRFFFQTAEKLVPADVNGDQGCPTSTAIGAGPACVDVYEWEAPGKGSCTTQSPAYSPSNGGCIYLLSTGTSSYPSNIADVSVSGDAAFFFTRDQLVPADSDSQVDIYAAKVDGGLASQHAVTPPSCEGDSCRGASSPLPDAPGAGTAVFEGPGNPTSSADNARCPKGKRKVRRRGKVRCVAKHRHRKRANNNRRASR